MWKSSVKLAISILIGLLLIVCVSLFVRRLWTNFQHRNDIFYVDAYNQYCDGRMVIADFKDYQTDIDIPDSVPSLLVGSHSGMMGIKGDNRLMSSKYYCYPVFIHRSSGCVDTLYAPQRGRIGVGYVCRSCYTGDWLVVESKIPYTILGESYIVDPNKRKPKTPINHRMSDYTYEGQHFIFNSSKTLFWIFSRTTPDIFGPYTMQELSTQLVELGIELPITLNGLVNWYVEEDQRDYSKIRPKPKEFYFPNQTRHHDKIIE